MDRCFGALIDAIGPLGGDVLFFGGDALFVAFVGAGHAVRAVDGAHAMLGALRTLGPIDTPLGAVRIRMSVGVATGVADVVVGDGPQWPLFLAGPAVTRTVRHEAMAAAGQVLVDEATAAALGHRGVEPAGEGSWRSRRPPRGAGSGAGVAAVGASPPLPLPASGRPELHVPVALRAAVLAGDAPTDHRHVAVAFVRLRELDRRPRRERVGLLARASEAVGAACARHDACWISTDVAADGATIVLAAGLPQQHDDDELRLVAVAREIVDGELGGDVSIGLHRGTAFVGDVGHPTRRSYTVNGLTPVTAARLAGRAGPAEILASAEVVSRLRGRYETGPPADLTVKGRREPVRSMPLGGLATATATAAAGSAASPPSLVGRVRERDTLHGALARHEAGAGAVVEIVGPPGMGKSALLRWFLDAAPPPRLSITGEVAQRVVAFAALAAPLRRAVGAATAADARAVLGRLGDLAPLVAPIVDVEMAPTVASRMIEEASIADVRAALVAALLGERPGLIVVEDAHWLDPTSVELLARLAGPLAEAGWLVVVTRRPDVAPLSTAAETLVLDPLSDADVGRLAAAESGRPLSDAVLASIVERAGGNALYALQLASSVDTTADVGLPESAERVIGARIDLLPAAARARLRRASVLGGRVELALLAEVAGDPSIADASGWGDLDEFVEVAGVAGSSTAEVRFRHDQFRRAAYEGLSYAERTRLHAAAAETLGRRPDTPAAVLAEHWSRAGDAVQVVRWATRAADEAAERAAFVDEARLRRMVATSARAAGVPAAERSRLFVQLGRSYETNAQFDAAAAAYRQAARLVPSGERAPIRTRLAALSFRQDEVARARRQVAAAMRLLPATGSEQDALRAELLILRAAIRGQAGDRRRSDEDARAAEAMAVRLGRDDLRGEALMQRALNADMVDDPGTGSLIAVALPLLEAAGRHREVAVLHLNRGITHMVQGRWPEALDSYDLAAAGFARCGDVLGGIVTDVNRGGLLLEQGHPDDAVELFDAVTRRARAAGHHRIATFASGSAHRARAWTGSVDDAIAGLESAIEELRAHGHRGEADDLDAYVVEAQVLAGRFAEARARAAALLRRLADRSSEVVVLTTRRLAAVAAHFEGDPGAIGELQAVLDDARSADRTIEVARCLAALQTMVRPGDPAWPAEEAACRATLAVEWMPPVTFAGAAAT